MNGEKEPVVNAEKEPVVYGEKEPVMNGEKGSAEQKASTLIEALPWLARFHGKTVVIKYGGNAMTDAALRAGFADDIVFLRYAGLRPVVVHGGGPQISAALKLHGIASEFKDGLRVTSPEAMDVVRMVLAGQVGPEIVGLINRHGPFALSMSGQDSGLFTAEPLSGLGRVGEIGEVDASAVHALLDYGRIPVISSVAVGRDNEIYNVNADTAAAALAVALSAEKLIMLTDVEGLYADYPARERLISQLTADGLEKLIPDLASGMIPKMEACLTAVRGGVRQAHVLDGRDSHAVLLEVFTDEGIGTMVIP